MFRVLSRMNRERITIDKMIKIYCRDHHRTKRNLCAQCLELKNYAMGRLDNCPYQGKKTTCAKCPVHCYSRDKREKVRQVMRYAGPRMTFKHPILALLHMIDGVRS